ncbi:17099_t:CDS:2, partial [Racocetra fulgida]
MNGTKYPTNGTCQRKEDKENYGKRRSEIVNLDISNQNLEDGKGRPMPRVLNFSYNNYEQIILKDFFGLAHLIVNNNQLKELSLRGTKNLQELNCSNNFLLTNLTLDYSATDATFTTTKTATSTEIVCINNDSAFLGSTIGLGVYSGISTLDQNYPNKEEVKEIKWREKEKKLTVALIITDFPQLEKINARENKLTQLHLKNCPQLTYLNCQYNNLTELTITNCPNLQEIYAYGNQLTNLNLSNNQQLEALQISNNNFSSDLSFLSHLVNSKGLYLGNNKFTGSLEPLRNLQKLEGLYINNTDLSQGLEFLPDSIKDFRCQGTKFEKELKDFDQQRVLSGSSQTEDADKDCVIFYEEEKTLHELISEKHRENIPNELSEQYNDLCQKIKQLLQDNQKKIITLNKTQDLGQLITQEVINKMTEMVEESDKIFSVTEKPILENKIGEGGYGEVYRGKHEARDVAIKKLLLNDNDKKQEIRNEINILKRLKDRNIIQYYGVYYEGREILIIMDYAENGTLTRQITKGLIYIHGKNIIHRDLKSLNVLMTTGNQAKISDFGLSIKNISSLQSDSIVGKIAAKCTTPFEKSDDNSIVFEIAFNNIKEIIPADTPKNIQDIIKGYVDESNDNIFEQSQNQTIDNQTSICDIELGENDFTNQEQTSLQIQKATLI